VSEFTMSPYEELRPFGEMLDDLRDRASEMLGRIGTRMGFGETAIAYSTEGGEPAEDNGVADMAKDEKPKVEVKDEIRTGRDGADVTVHTEFLTPGSTGPCTGEGTPVPKDEK